MLLLILTAEQAAAVRGETDRAALDPRPLADGSFALPERVLQDPSHAMHHVLLDVCPRRPLEDCVWLDLEA